MNVFGEQKATARAAEPTTFAIKAPIASHTPSPAVSTHPALEVEAEYGCVDWFQYRVQAGEDPTRH